MSGDSQTFAIPKINSPNGIISQSISNLESLKNTNSVRHNDIKGKISGLKERNNNQQNIDLN